MISFQKIAERGIAEEQKGGKKDDIDRQGDKNKGP